MKEADTLWLENTQFGIIENFTFPSLTQYVLSETSKADDLLSVLLQMKLDGKIIRIVNELNEISRDTKRAGKLQKEFETRIKRSFGDKSKSDTSFTLKLSAWFFSLNLNKTINLDYFNRKEHFMFLNDIISCRAESGHLRKSIERIFAKKLE